MATAKQKAFISDVIEQTNLLNIRHNDYVTQFVSRANEELYSLLADMMEVCEAVWESDEIDLVKEGLRKSLRIDFGIKTQKNSTLTALIIKRITLGNRQIVHNYAKVIEAAASAGVRSTGLVDYIKEKGSIDAIRKNITKAEEIKKAAFEQKRRVESMQRALIGKEGLGYLEFSNGRKKVEAIASDVEFTITLSHNRNGREKILATLYPSSNLQRACLEEYLLACSVAAFFDSDHFYDICKDQGFNVDIMHRWMRDNNLHTDSEVSELLKRVGLKKKNSVDVTDVVAEVS